MRNIEDKAFDSLKKQGYYQNKFKNLLETKYIDFIVSGINQEVNKIK